MPIRPLIVALLWLTYALSLGHSLLPHHHHRNAGHDEHKDHGGHHHTVGAHHHDPTADHDDQDHDSKEASADADWWFGHQHIPGIEFSQVAASDTYQAPAAADLIIPELPRFTVVIRWLGQTVGWPPTQSKAPPGRQHPFRPLRAPPTAYSLA